MQNNQVQKGISFKIILIGDSGIGKTSLIYKYIHGKFKSEYQVTVGVDFSSKTVSVQSQDVQLQIWDTCGQDIYKSITSSFYRGAAAVFLVYSVDSRKSFQSAQSWLEEFKEKGSPLAFVFLIGTKADLEKVVTREQAVSYLRKIKGISFTETSAKTGQNIGELFSKAAQIMYKFYESSMDFRNLVMPNRVTQMPLIRNNSNNQKEKKQRKCC